MYPTRSLLQCSSERIGQDDAQAGYILDGFPRTVAQVESLDGLLGADGLSRVVVFEVDEGELTERMLSRGRTDDTAETIHNRFQVYTDQTQPLIDVYDDRGLTMLVNGMGEMDEITDRIVHQLGDTTR